KTFIGQEAPRLARLDFSNLKEDTVTLLQGTRIARDLRKGMLLNGVDLMRVAGFVSAAHTPEIIAETVQAFDRTLGRMQREGLLDYQLSPRPLARLRRGGNRVVGMARFRAVRPFHREREYAEAGIVCQRARRWF